MCFPSLPAVSFPFQFQSRLPEYVDGSAQRPWIMNKTYLASNIAFTTYTSSSTPFLPPLRDCQHSPTNKKSNVDTPLAIRSRFHPNVTMEMTIAEILTDIGSGESAPSLFASTYGVDDDIGR